MENLLTSQIEQKIIEARELYYHLVLVVGPANSGKTAALQAISASASVPIIHINLELSQRMLDMTVHQRIRKTLDLLRTITKEVDNEFVLLDNIELLFDVHLEQNPLRLLQMLSRTKTIVAAWNGSIGNKKLTYAVPGHPEYRGYPIGDFLAVSSLNNDSDIQSNLNE